MKYILLLALLIPTISWSAMTKVQDMMRLEEATNILTNPAFESPVADQGWTNPGAAVGVVETSVVIQGKQSLKFSPTIGQTVNLSQHSSLYATSFADGVQGLAMIWLKSSMALTVCTIQNGTTSSTNCVITQTDSKWKLYKLPMILGSGNNGISVTGTSVGGSNTVYADAAFVGAVDLKQDINVVGPWTSYTPTTAWTNNTATGKWRQVGDSIEVQYKMVMTGTPVGGTLLVNIPSQFTINSSKLPTPQSISDIAGSAIAVDSSIAGYFNMQTAYFNTTQVILVYQSSASGQMTSVQVNTPVVFAINDEISGSFRVPVNELSSATSTYSSTNGNTSLTSYTPVITTGTGTMTNATATGRWQRNGDRLKVYAEITMTSPVGTWSAPSISIPSGLVIDTAKVGTFGNIGNVWIADTGSNNYGGTGVVVGTTTTVTTQTDAVLTHVGTVPVTSQGISQAFPFAFATGDIISFVFEVPIVGWDNSNIIIGSFAEVQTVPGTNKVISFAVEASATCTASPCSTRVLGTTVAANTTTRTGVGLYAQPIAAGKCSSVPFCTGNLYPTVNGANRCWAIGATTVSVALQCYNGANANVDEGFSFSCMCQAP